MGSSALLAQNPINLPGQLGPTQKAAPLTTREKFGARVIQALGVRALIGAGINSSIGQLTNTPSEWGQGFVGYADRYASAYGSSLSRQSMAFVLETALHEDPRYFPSEEKGFKARMKSVLIQSVTTRTDNQQQRLAYSRFISAFANGQLVNAWQPRSTGSPGDGIQRGFITLGGDAAYNFLQEFFPWARPRSIRKNKP